ncbi:hypothetical protein [Haloarchaeobius sp. FL176]|uniref:hypothetical protein n=1 Tax=Haloarchaeobius sp. FL176 TaxID=2967129 RepID=UPI002148D005|nr:hypothetical protein [Haloarchaeobius sp. FL176]
MPSPTTNRRTLLGVVGSTAISGCTTFGAQEDDVGIARIVELETESSSAALPFEGEILARGSVDEPPRIRVVLENSGGPTGGSFGSTPPFSTHGATDEDGVIASLVPENRDIVVGTDELFPDDPTEHCWRLAGPIGFRLYHGYTELDTGDELATEFTVWVGPDEQCLPAGEYSASFAPEAGEGTDPLAELALSFTVES